MNRLHFDDLKRRYREADWVSEYQRLWAIFNYWYSNHLSDKKTDRECIDKLKTVPELSRWIDDVIKASMYNRPHRITDGYGGSYPHFAANNVISRFFLAAEISTTLNPRINWPWRTGSEKRVKLTHALTLTSDQFREAYFAHSRALSSREGILFNETFHQVISVWGVGATGCCFYRMNPPVIILPNTKRLAELTLQELKTVKALDVLVLMIDSTKPTDLGSDIIETLYNLRNAAVHGDLDFLKEEDNAVARAGLDLLDLLIRNVRDCW